MSSNRILVVAAHPMDEIMGVGGTTALHAQEGDEVFACILATAPELNPAQERIDTLRKEAQASGAILGYREHFFYDFPYFSFNAVPMLDLVRAIQDAGKEARPDIVYTHHRGEVNTDHQAVFNATMAAFRSFGENKVRKILCYEDPSSTTWAPPFLEYAFIPNVFRDISTTIQKKVDAIAAYKSEHRDFPHPRSGEAIRVTAEVWGIKVSAGPTEAFELIRDL